MCAHAQRAVQRVRVCGAVTNRNIPECSCGIVPVQQVCELAALTVRKLSLEGKISSEQPIRNGFLHVAVRVLNSYVGSYFVST